MRSLRSVVESPAYESDQTNLQGADAGHSMLPKAASKLDVVRNAQHLILCATISTMKILGKPRLLSGGCIAGYKHFLTKSPLAVT